MKQGLNIAGVVLGLMGIIFFFQGIGVLPGSFMTGQSQWAVIGAVLVIISAGLLVYTNRRK